MIYLIDHQDSFTFNLAHLLADFDEVYVSNYFEINNFLNKFVNNGFISKISPQFFEQIISLQSSNEEIKLEAQKRIKRDFSE